MLSTLQPRHTAGPIYSGDPSASSISRSISPVSVRTWSPTRSSGPGKRSVRFHEGNSEYEANYGGAAPATGGESLKPSTSQNPSEQDKLTQKCFESFLESLRISGILEYLEQQQTTLSGKGTSMVPPTTTSATGPTSTAPTEPTSTAPTGPTAITSVNEHPVSRTMTRQSGSL